jgi:4-hydroxybenzoate polyprenyltransferase
VQCSVDSSINASGFEIATGTGKLFNEKDSSNPAVFVLIIIPVILLILAFTNKSFAALSYASIAGVVAKTAFTIYAHILLNSNEYKGAFELTVFNWLILAMYIGLCAFIYYCKDHVDEDLSESDAT